jgi:peptidyl-prolyl cis-trans isomerase A (cyclophilin A)
MRYIAPALVVGIALAMAVSVEGQAPAMPPRPGGEVAVRIMTALGNIDLVVDAAHAPVTARNFLSYVDAGLYDGGRFYRVTRPDNYTPTPPNRPMMNLIEGDIDPARTSERRPAIPLERTSVTGLRHVTGTVSMGREDDKPDSATADFFILLDDQPSLDFGGKRFTDAQGAAAFGRVVAGLAVVRTIQQQGPLLESNRQHLVTPVAMTSVKRR